MRNQDHETAMNAITTANRHAVAFDQMDISGIEAYTCPVLNGYTVDHSKDRRTDWSLVGSIQDSLTDENVLLPSVSAQISKHFFNKNIKKDRDFRLCPLYI